MKRVFIDCAGVKNGRDLWQRYVQAAQPEGAGMFGRNLDAFWDAISAGGPGWPGEDVELIFSNSAALAKLTSGSGQSYLKHFQDFAREQHVTPIILT
jgi:ribonuclease inhibitor